tara:strand:- start:180 stop:602 length:423 start_codon:yes stop_codon:yes gene_type:complete
MIKKVTILLIFLIFLPNLLFANTQFFQEGINLYNIKKYDEAKFKFEQDIVFNPKNEISYLYLSKIFKNLEKRDLEEQNLNTVILLNPSNEEAIYHLARLKLDSSDYEKSRELNKKLISLCNKFCSQSEKLKVEIENLSKK